MDDSRGLRRRATDEIDDERATPGHEMVEVWRRDACWPLGALHCHRRSASLNQDKQLVLHDGSVSGSCRTQFDDGALLLLFGRWRGAAVVLLVRGGDGIGSGRRPSAGAGLVVLRRSMLATAMATGLSGRC